MLNKYIKNPFLCFAAIEAGKKILNYFCYEYSFSSYTSSNTCIYKFLELIKQSNPHISFNSLLTSSWTYDSEEGQLAFPKGKNFIFLFGLPMILNCVEKRRQDNHNHADLEMHFKFLATESKAKEIKNQLQNHFYPIFPARRETCLCVKQKGKEAFTNIARINKSEIKSFICEDTHYKELEKDIDNFINSEETYKAKGIPYRRGYLLEGPPGTGKTSFIRYISVKNALFINVIKSNDLINQDLNQLFRNMLPLNNNLRVMLIEDIDGIFHKRDAAKKAQSSKLSFSDLINAMDGIHPLQNVIFFITTNKIEDLDQALLRPGRIDKIVTVGYCSVEQQKAMIKRFYDQETEEFFLREKQISNAELQELLISTDSFESFTQQYKKHINKFVGVAK